MEPTNQELEWEYPALTPLLEWINSLHERINNDMGKTVRYGSGDLHTIGAAMRRLAPGISTEISDEEIAVAFYTMGKIARIFSGYEMGQIPDSDSWYDLHFYSMMAMKIRQTGGWL